MKISIITVCYNSVNTIGDTIVSLASQKYSEWEHIIVDGASRDGTLDIIKNASYITKFISEPDNGIYDAMNKGLTLAKGDIIGFLNSDDFYADDTILTQVAEVFKDTSIQACYADLVYVDQHDANKTVRYWKSRDYVTGLFKSGWMPAHPTFFVRKSVYERFGMFNLNYRIAADFDLLFRLIEQNNIKTKYLPKVLVKMRLGGTTNKSYENIWIQNKEIVNILHNYYPDFSLSKFILSKFFDRAKQFINRPKY